MGILKLDSWHSIHAGQTIDDAINGLKNLFDRLGKLEALVQYHSNQIEAHSKALDKKYDKAGGPIIGEGDSNRVEITGGSNPNQSILKVRYIDGISSKQSSTNGVLYLNHGTTGNIYFGSRGNAHITTDGKVFGAVWNDFAEFRKSDEVEAGRVICENGDGSLSRSYKRLQPGACIVSDTFGFAIGETNDCKTPIAVAGRVLAYPYEDWWCFEPGQPVCAGPNGTVSMMSRREARKYPDRIIGTVSELPTYEKWGNNNIQVNGRIWIKIK